MNIVLWIITGFLAVAFLIAGVLKLSQPKDKLAASGLEWVEEFSAGQVKAIGAVELMAAIGLILPAVLDVAVILVPLAAAGLALVMVGAAVTHGRRHEYPMIIVNIVLLVLAVIVAWGRSGPYAF